MQVIKCMRKNHLSFCRNCNKPVGNGMAFPELKGKVDTVWTLDRKDVILGAVYKNQKWKDQIKDFPLIKHKSIKQISEVNLII
jgi:hypothetical protein